MLERVVQYLRSHDIPFRLSSLPSPEPLPAVAYRLPPGGLMVETHVLLVGAEPAIACTARGAKLNLPRLRIELGAEVIEGSAEDLPPPFTGMNGPKPPLGGAMGTLTLLDEAVTACAVVGFAAFASTDIVEMLYEDFSRLERPRNASFAVGGELPERSEVSGPESLEVGEPERKSA